MGIITLPEPYSSNELKRLIKTPKLYFCDTGLCAYLSSWTSRDVLMNGAAAGHYYENHVVGEFVRNVAYGKNKVNLNFYRDQNMKEIDLIAEENGVLHPVEIKKASEPDRKLLRAFSVLKETEKHVGNGGIVCMTDVPLPIDEKTALFRRISYERKILHVFNKDLTANQKRSRIGSVSFCSMDPVDRTRDKRRENENFSLSHKWH